MSAHALPPPPLSGLGLGINAPSNGGGSGFGSSAGAGGGASTGSNSYVGGNSGGATPLSPLGSPSSGLLLPLPAGMGPKTHPSNVGFSLGAASADGRGRVVATIVGVVLFFLLLSFFVAPPPMLVAKTGALYGGDGQGPPSLPLDKAASPTGLPLANYAAVIDAGSSGSRIYVYQYRLPFSDQYNPAGSGASSSSSSPSSSVSAGAGASAASLDGKVKQVAPGGDVTGDPTADVLHIAIAEDAQHRAIIKKQEPGLSAFGSHPADAFTSIKPLLDFAAAHIPAPLVASTPIYILATAGLRLLPAVERDAVLESVRAGLRAEAARGRFSFTSDSQVNVISGEEEGVYGWVALNYLRNRFGDLAQPYPTGGLDPHSFSVLPTPPVNPYYLDNASSSGSGSNGSQASGSGSGASAGAGGGGERTNRPGQGKHLGEVDSAGATNTGTGTGAGTGNASAAAPTTVGLVEIGGGSAQIAFEAPDVEDIDIDGDGIPDPGTGKPHPPDFVFNLDLDLVSCDSSSSGSGAGAVSPGKTVEMLTGEEAVRQRAIGRLGKGGHKYSVYTASFLGFGANSARDRYVAARAEAARREGRRWGRIEDPCLLEGQQQRFRAALVGGWGENVEAVEDAAGSAAIDKDRDHYTFVGTGDWHKCRELLVPLLDADLPCPYPCPFGGKYQPALTPAVLAKNFYAFSEYWYSTRDVLDMDPAAFSGFALEQASLALCQKDSNSFAKAQERLRAGGYPAATSLARLRQQCFKSAWLDVVLFRGHGFPRAQAQSVQPVSSIEGTEVQWSLGALLVLVTDKVKADRGFCRALQRNDNIADAHMKATFDHARSALISGSTTGSTTGSGTGSGSGSGAASGDHKPGKGYAETPVGSSSGNGGDDNNNESESGATSRYAWRAGVLLLLTIGGVLAAGNVLVRVCARARRRAGLSLGGGGNGGGSGGGSGGSSGLMGGDDGSKSRSDIRWQPVPMIVSGEV